MSVGSLESLGQLACLLCLEKRGEEQTGPEWRGEKMQGNQTAVAAVQTTHPKGFDFSNTAESCHNVMPLHLINSATYLDNATPKFNLLVNAEFILFHAGKKENA